MNNAFTTLAKSISEFESADSMRTETVSQVKKDLRRILGASMSFYTMSIDAVIRRTNSRAYLSNWKSKVVHYLLRLPGNVFPPQRPTCHIYGVPPKVAPSVGV